MYDTLEFVNGEPTHRGHENTESQQNEERSLDHAQRSEVDEAAALKAAVASVSASKQEH